MTARTASRPVRLTLPTLLVGPRAQGRNYDILRRSSEDALARELQGLISDFTLSLAGWAEGKPPEFVAFFPVAGGKGSIMARGRYLGEASQGSIATAVLVLLDSAALKAVGDAPQQLIPFLPDPQDPQAGAEPLVADVLPGGEAPLAGRLSRLGAAWRDRVLDTGGEDPRAALVEALYAVQPRAQRSRLTGWASTAGLPKIGRFSPAELFRLVTHASGDTRALEDLPHLPMRLEGGLLIGDEVDVPEARQAWERLRALEGSPALHKALEALAWSPASAGIAAADMVALGAIDACLTLDTGTQIELLTALARRAADRSDPLHTALRQGLMGAFTGLIDTTPASAPTYIDAYVEAGPEAIEQARPVLAAAAGRIEVLKRLKPVTVEALVRAGALDAFAGDVAPQALGKLDNASALALLNLAVVRAVGDDRHWRLACLLSAQLARAGSLPSDRASAFAQILEALAKPRDGRDLAEAAVVKLVHRQAPDRFGLFVRRALAPALADARAPERQMRAALASLTALQLGAPT